MKKYNIYPYRTDIVLNKKKLNKIDTDIMVIDNIKDDQIYKTIYFNNINDIDKIENILTNELLFILKKTNISNKDNIFIVGLGNENYTADSIGPKVLKYIKVNAFLENLGLKIQTNKVSALSPGVLGQTGIITEKIISSISKEIKPNLVILIDSFVSNDVSYLNKTIQLNNVGLNPGSGLHGINFKIDQHTINSKIITIGVTTGLEIKLNNKDNYIPYIMSTKDIDEYVNIMSEAIGKSINKAIDNL